MRCRLTFIKWQLVKIYCINSSRLLNIVLGLLVALASDWLKLLFVGLSGFHSDFPVLVSNKVVWIITKFVSVITYGYFKMWCQTSLILITFPCGCFQFCFIFCSDCWYLSELTRLVLYKILHIGSSYHQQM